MLSAFLRLSPRRAPRFEVGGGLALRPMAEKWGHAQVSARKTLFHRIIAVRRQQQAQSAARELNCAARPSRRNRGLSGFATEADRSRFRPFAAALTVRPLHFHKPVSRRWWNGSDRLICDIRCRELVAPKRPAATLDPSLTWRRSANRRYLERDRYMAACLRAEGSGLCNHRDRYPHAWDAYRKFRCLPRRRVDWEPA